MEFEQKLSRLDELVKKMEKGDATLEQTLQYFEEGVRLSKDCQTQLQEAEVKIRKLVAIDANGQMQTEDFKIES